MFKVHAKRVAIFAILGLFAGFFVARTLPKLYGAQTDILINDAKMFQNYDPQIAAILARFGSNGIETELGMLQSKGMFENAVIRVSEKRHEPELVQRIDELYKHYEVGAAEGSSVAVLSTKANDPQLAADIVNEVAAFYNSFREDKSKESLSTGQEVLKKRMDETQADLRLAEQKVREYKERYEITDPAVESSQLASYSASLEQQRDAAYAELAAVRQQISTQKAKLQVLPNYQKTSITREQTPKVIQFETKLATLQAERLALLEKYQPTSQKVKDYDALIAKMQADLHTAMTTDQFKESTVNMQKDPVRAQIESGLASNEIQAKSLASKVNTANQLMLVTSAKIKSLPEREMNYSQFQREKQIHETQYMALKSQHEDLKRKIDAAAAASSSLFPAKAEPKPVAPDPLKLAIVGVIAGIVLGILFSFLIETLRLPVRTSAQLADLTGLPVSATVPLMPRGKAAKLLASLPDPNTRPAESFRFMAFSQLAREGGAPKLILFTGIGGTVGCSSSAAQFALATARTGARTLLVDADLRHPAITTSFEANDQSGVSDMLNRTLLASEGADLSVETAHKNLRVIPAGTDGMYGLSDYPTSHIVGIMNSLAEKADVVIIDAPPCDIVADASRLVPYVDQVCLVVSASSTSFRKVPMAYDILKSSGAKEISLILTHASPQDEPFSKRSKYLVNAES